ncbi:hypothetical protein Tco_0464907, partial [Tanacetum coccineum]
MVEGTENVIDDSSNHRNNDPNIPGTRLESRSDKESSEVEITNAEEVEITNAEEVEINNCNTYTEKTPGFDGILIISLLHHQVHPTPSYLPQTAFSHYSKPNLLVSNDIRVSFRSYKDDIEVMVESLPTMVDKHIKEQVKKQVPKQVKVQVPVYVAKGAEISLQIQKVIANDIPSLVDASVRSYMSAHILHDHPVQSQTISVQEQQY